MLTQYRAKRRDIARADRFNSGLKPCYWAVLPDCIGERHQLRPVLETIFQGDDSLCVARTKRCSPNIRNGLAAELWVQPFEAPFGRFVSRLQSGEQRVGLILVILDRGAERKRASPAHGLIARITILIS